MGMEGFLAKLTILAAGILLSSALALTGCGQAAPDCKTSTGDPACAKAAQPVTAAKASPAAEASAVPKPRPEPQVVGRPVPAAKNKQAGARVKQRHPLTRRTARHSPPHRTYAQARWRDRQESQQDAYDGRRDGREYRPPPAYQSAPGPVAGGCDYACQYRAWLERYSAWYDRYGRTYNAAPRGNMRQAAPPPYGSDDRHDDRLSRAGTAQHPDQSERDRLAPWHGYNPSDGPENGY